MNLLEQLLPAIAQTMIREKKGSPNLIRELSAIVFRDDSNRITKKSINQAIAWFYRSNVIGYCGQVNEGNVLDVTPNCRFYFRDLGVAGYFLDMAGARPDTISGIINENFVYCFWLYAGVIAALFSDDYAQNPIQTGYVQVYQVVICPQGTP